MRIISGIIFTVGLAALSSFAISENAAAASDKLAEAPETRGLLLPYIDPARGRFLYADKGCIVCHAINGVGGEDAPPLDAANMPAIMNPFEFAARMWRGAGTMITMQEDELGMQIEFTGSELIDIIAFVHSADEQKDFSKADIPAHIKDLMLHLGGETEKHESEEHN